MKRLLVVVALAACTEHGQTPDGPNSDLTDPDTPPCHCVSEGPPVFDGTCCDTTLCYFDEEAGHWQIVICDVFPPLDPCQQCTADQICVQGFDGSCLAHSACVDRVVECPDNACTPECEAAYCVAPSQCQNGGFCGTESPLAFKCYGP